MSSDDLLDVESENKKIEHKFIFTKNEAKLSGVFAWVLYANMILYFILGLIELVNDLKDFF